MNYDRVLVETRMPVFFIHLKTKHFAIRQLDCPHQDFIEICQLFGKKPLDLCLFLEKHSMDKKNKVL